MPNFKATTATLARMAEGYMTDRIRFIALGEPEFDAETGETTVPETDVIETKCQIVPTSISDRVVEVAEAPLTLKLYKIYVPRDVTSIREGHLGEVVSSSDPALPGQRLFVKDVMFETHQASRRVVAEYRHQDQEEVGS